MGNWKGIRRGNRRQHGAERDPRLESGRGIRSLAGRRERSTRSRKRLGSSPRSVCAHRASVETARLGHLSCWHPLPPWMGRGILGGMEAVWGRDGLALTGLLGPACSTGHRSGAGASAWGALPPDIGIVTSRARTNITARYLSPRASCFISRSYPRTRVRHPHGTTVQRKPLINPVVECRFQAVHELPFQGALPWLSQDSPRKGAESARVAVVKVWELCWAKTALQL